MEEVILVNEKDEEIGMMEKMEAHRKAVLHRAFSIFIFNGKNELMLQRRALEKYHSPGLWSNTCCSHPRKGENVVAAGHRRLMEEMGFDCEIRQIFSFIYKAELDKGMTEHELDHVLIGKCESHPEINKEEVHDWKWISLFELDKDMSENPEDYTVWFKTIWNRVRKELKINN